MSTTNPATHAGGQGGSKGDGQGGARRPALPPIPSTPPVADFPPSVSAAAPAPPPQKNKNVMNEMNMNGDAHRDRSFTNEEIVIRKGAVGAARAVPVPTRLTSVDVTHSVEPSPMYDPTGASPAPMSGHHVTTGMSGSFVDEPAAVAKKVTSPRSLPTIPPTTRNVSGGSASTTTGPSPPPSAAMPTTQPPNNTRPPAQRSSSSSTSTPQYHPQTMAQLMGSGSGAKPADTPSTGGSSTPASGPMGPRPPPGRRQPSVPVHTSASVTGAHQPLALTPASAGSTATPATTTTTSSTIPTSASSYLSHGTETASRRTDIPSQTIRDLEATLKDIADLPDEAPAVPPVPPLTLPPQPLSQSPKSFTAALPPDCAPETTPPAAREPTIDKNHLFSEPQWTKGSSSTPDLSSPIATGAGLHMPEPSPPSSGGVTPPANATGQPPSAAATRGGLKVKGPRLSLNTTGMNSAPNLGDLLRDHAPPSPSMKHWQQVRHHVLDKGHSNTIGPSAGPGSGSPPPRPMNQGHKGLKYVTKAVERFGFRNAVENVMGHDRRGSQFGGYSFGKDISEVEREEGLRQRRRFARDIKQCLDQCATEESRRRLARMAPAVQPEIPADMMPQRNAGQKSAHATKSGGTKGWGFAGNQHHHQHHQYPNNHHAQSPQHQFQPMMDSATSTYAPLLTVLHNYIGDARAKRIWSRTCPHHAAILAELGVTFLNDNVSTDAERIQALEVFGTVVKNWGTESADEELNRWLWLCRAMLVNDRQLRQRGLALLSQLLRRDPSLPGPLVRPMTADDFEAVAIALLRLLHALESGPGPSANQKDIVDGLLADLRAGQIISVNPTTVPEIVNDIDPTVPIEDLERELLWLSAGRALAVDQGTATWLLSHDGTVLKRYSPTPIVPATPLVIRHLRAIAATVFFSSLSTVVRRTSNLDVVSSVAEAADYVYEDARGLIEDERSLVIGYVTVLLDIELKQSQGRLVDNSDDPFSDSLRRSGAAASHLRLLQLIKSSPSDVVEKVAEQLVTSYPATQRHAAVKYFLESDLGALGRACVPYLLQRLTPQSAENPQTKPFLLWLSQRHPQLFYKPLFTCAAATQMATLTPPLRTVMTMSTLIGSDRFWTLADPQMVVVVLMGAAGSGKAKTGYGGELVVKPGRYAVMLELVLALQTLRTDMPPTTHLKTFLTALETRLAAMLEVEERTAPLPPVYRSLVCQLFVSLRTASWWTKRTAATRLAVAWYSRDHSAIPRSATLSSGSMDDEQSATLRDMLSVEDKATSQPRFQLMDKPLIAALSSLLVTIQASLLEEDWAAILPLLWERYSLPREPNLEMSFLIAKCSEQIPEVLHTLVLNDLFRSTDSTSPARTLLKLCMMYGYRYQLLTQPTIAEDERGIFKFPGKVFEFVATEMGADNWVMPRDAQDQALQKYGQSLPLEVRQRLMELGWSEDTQKSTSDFERIPVTLIPLSELHDEMVPVEKPPSPISPTSGNKLGLTRTLSNTSSVGGPKTRRPVLPPILLALINEQTRLMNTSEDVAVATLSYELVRMVEREDAAALIRPINDNLPVDLTSVVTRINSDVCGTTPSFAYVTLNSLVGYLKMSVRDHPRFQHWARILSTVSRVIPHVSEMSLRDIRKSKAEAVLLPGSIYEDGSGFKLHPPWQNDNLPIQTAQLMLLVELLRVNPRDVYLIKKLLFNLQVQASFTHLPFARAWIELVVKLFAGLNSNYNDRAEFRHFLNNIATVLALHGKTDIIVAVQAMSAISMCAVRFRRVFASIGFVNIMRTVYETYVFAHDAIKDCIEYALRSIYRIHRDVFVYQLCLALAEDPFDPEAAYNLLSSLSVANSPSSGVASGIRGVNDKQEVDALIQMLSSGAELSLSEIGSTAEERRAQKAATLNLGPVLFPQDNIIRLLVTVIAVNAASPRAIKLLKLFATLVPYMKDKKSVELLPEGVDAIGRYIHKEKLGDDQYMHRLLPGEESAAPDWPTASREYVMLVDVAVKSGCALSVHATRRLLDIVLVLLQSQGESIGPTASSVLGSLTRVHLSGRNPSDFLRDIAPPYRQSLPTVDFSGVLESITDLIRREQYDLPQHTTALVIHEYVAPVIRMLAYASEESMAFIVPVRTAAVDLLATSVFLPGSETLDVLESVTSSPGLLASVILPLVLLFDKPRDVDRDEAYTNFWIRILRIVLHPMGRAARSSRAGDTAQTLASVAVVSLQIVKVIILRAPECVSAVPGLWSYISTELLKAVTDGDGKFYNSVVGTPRVVDWMMWSLFELLVLHRTPLHIDCRLRIQTVLAKMGASDDDRSSRPSSIGSLSDTPGARRLSAHTPSRSLSGLVRRPSARVVTPSASPTATHASSDLATPIRAQSHQRNASSSSAHLSPGHSRLRSVSGNTSGSGSATPSPSPSGLGIVSPIRPSFADLSARRASRPTFDVFPDSPRTNRFPSSAPVRALQVHGQAEKSAIVHLLGPATHLVSTTSAGVAVNVGLRDPRRNALRDIRLTDPELVAAARKAVATTMAVYGYSTEGEEPMLQVWSVPDALRAITEQTKTLVEVEFRNVFNPPRVGAGATQALSNWTAADLAANDLSTVDEKDGSFYTAKEVDDTKEEEAQGRPSFSFTLSSAYDEPSFQTFKVGRDRGEEEQISVPTLSISQFS